MKATKSGMAGYSTQELYDYAERKDAQYQKASAWSKRNNWQGWQGSLAAICAEIQSRMLNGTDERNL